MSAVLLALFRSGPMGQFTSRIEIRYGEYAGRYDLLLESRLDAAGLAVSWRASRIAEMLEASHLVVVGDSPRDHCLHCGESVPAVAAFCPACGGRHRLFAAATACDAGHASGKGAYCERCGHVLGAPLLFR